MSANVTPSATEVANGGMVFIAYVSAAQGMQIIYAEWIPLTPPIAVSESSRTVREASGAGQTATFTVALATQPQ